MRNIGGAFFTLLLLSGIIVMGLICKYNDAHEIKDHYMLVNDADFREVGRSQFYEYYGGCRGGVQVKFYPSENRVNHLCNL